MGKGDNGGFSQEQLDMYKECFKLMDIDKDGTLSKSDLRAAFDNVGKLMDESELDAMLGEVGGGSNDPDDLIVRAFKAYEVDGKIEAEMFRHALMNFGDKFNKAEVDDIFGEFEVDDDGFIASKDVIGLFVAGGGEEKKEEAPPPAEEAPAEAPEEEEEEGRQVNKIAYLQKQIRHLLTSTNRIKNNRDKDHDHYSLTCYINTTTYEVKNNLYCIQKVFMLRRLSLYLTAQIFPYAMI